jgi:hypothetical protein
MSLNKAYTRKDLKQFFRNGQIPTENHFGFLIDSSINKQDDGLYKDDLDGLVLSPSEDSKRLLSFKKNINDEYSFFRFEKDEDLQSPILRLSSITPGSGEKDGNQDEKAFFFHENGNLSVGSKSDKGHKVHVKGFIGMEGRAGTFEGKSADGKAPANARWHPIVEGLDNCQAFEIVARTGKIKSGKFAIIHAYALSAFGNSRSKIKITSAHYGSFWGWSKIKLRWKSYGTHNYALEIKTNSNYGEGIDIFYKITRLWDDRTFLPAHKDYYY